MSEESQKPENNEQQARSVVKDSSQGKIANEPKTTEKENSSPASAKKPRVSKTAKTAKKKTAKNTEGESSEKADPVDNKQVNNSNEEQNSSEIARKQGRNRRSRGGRGNRQDSPEEPKVKVDKKIVTKRAWKIFLGEVNEEGLALIGDKEARELAKRSLRVAEIYSLEEAAQVAKGKQLNNRKNGSKNKLELKDKSAVPLSQPKAPVKAVELDTQPKDASKSVPEPQKSGKSGGDEPQAETI